MLVVLLVIAVLILLFVPNLSGQKKGIEDKGDKAIVKVVDTQIELYNLNETDQPTWGKLEEKKYLTAEQIDKAKKLKYTIKEEAKKD